MVDRLVTIATKQVPDRTADWDEDVRQLAYELYASDAGRSPTVVAKLLATDTYGSITIPEATIRRWARREGWDARADETTRQVFPGLTARALLQLGAKAPDAAAYLGNVASGHAAPDKQRIAAAVALLDRVGIGPVRATTVTLTHESAVPAPASRDYASLSDAELQAIEQRARQRDT